MAYPTPFLRLVASGTLHADEGFAFGMSLVPAFPTDDDGPDTVPQGVIDAISTFWLDPNVKMNPFAKLDLIKLNLIGTDGRYVKSTTVLAELSPAVTPTTNVSPYPPQVAMAVSLMTGVNRGLAARGRFFLPAPALGLEPSTGTAPQAGVTAVQTAAATMLNSINTAMATADGGGAGAWRVGVASDVREGAMREATGVRVGAAYDTIRSRRAQIPELYPTPLGVALAA